MVTVLCLEIEPAVLALLQRQRRPPILREAANPEHVIAALEHDPTATESLLLGKDVEDPLRLVHHAHALDADLSIVLLASSEAQPALREAIGFLPSLRGDVSCARVEELQELPARVEEAARRTQKRRMLRALARDSAERMEALVDGPSAAPFLARLLDTGPVGVVVLNSKGRIEFTNPSALDLLDPSRQRAIGRNFVLFFPETEWEALSHYLAQCSVTERRIPAQVFHCETPSGAARTLEITASPFPGGKGERGTLVFLTERRSAPHGPREVQEEARASAARQLADLASFAGDVGQRLGDPLESLVVNAELLGHEIPPDPALQAVLERIREEGARAAEICDQLQAFGGRRNLCLETLDLNDLVRDALRSLEPSLSHRIALHAELQPELPRVLVDRTLVVRALRSLLDFSARAIGPRAGRIEVATGRAEPRPERRLQGVDLCDPLLEPCVFLQVADDAREPDPAGRLRAFDRRARSRSPGADLALAAAVGAISSLGGSVEVDFPPGGGTALRVLFQPTEDHARDEVLAGRTVLIVQPEEQSRSLAQLILGHHGMTPHAARDGEEARQKLQESERPLDAVLLDLELIDPSLLAELELRQPSPPLIVTGVENEIETRARQLGCRPAAALTRPFTGFGLVRALRAVLKVRVERDARGPGPSELLAGP